MAQQTLTLLKSCKYAYQSYKDLKKLYIFNVKIKLFSSTIHETTKNIHLNTHKKEAEMEQNSTSSHKEMFFSNEIESLQILLIP